MNRISLLLGFVIVSACGGDEAPPAAEPAPAAAAPAPAAPALKPWTEALTGDDMVKYGEQVFMAKGSNTCNDCHGKDGKKGRLEQAANLTDPANWDSTLALDGDVAKVDKALHYLVSNGGKKFNESFVKDNPDLGWDWAKTDGDSFDVQMFGVTQSSTMSALKKIRKQLKKDGIEVTKDDLPNFGATAVLSYVRSLSSAPAAE